ncbi:hypothetical protein K438DRAFT_1785523 [Mycena galopus ATCC 62051]|nr:hypothetical protein K438DRAFT_1785523 [Mycena galopus ATCC 62051]
MDATMKTGTSRLNPPEVGTPEYGQLREEHTSSITAQLRDYETLFRHMAMVQRGAASKVLALPPNQLTRRGGEVPHEYARRLWGESMRLDLVKTSCLEEENPKIDWDLGDMGLKHQVRLIGWPENLSAQNLQPGPKKKLVAQQIKVLLPRLLKKHNLQEPNGEGTDDEDAPCLESWEEWGKELPLEKEGILSVLVTTKGTVLQQVRDGRKYLSQLQKENEEAQEKARKTARKKVPQKKTSTLTDTDNIPNDTAAGRHPAPRSDVDNVDNATPPRGPDARAPCYEPVASTSRLEESDERPAKRLKTVHTGGGNSTDVETAQGSGLLKRKRAEEEDIAAPKANTYGLASGGKTRLMDIAVLPPPRAPKTLPPSAHHRCRFESDAQFYDKRGRKRASAPVWTPEHRIYAYMMAAEQLEQCFTNMPGVAPAKVKHCRYELGGRVSQKFYVSKFTQRGEDDPVSEDNSAPCLRVYKAESRAWESVAKDRIPVVASHHTRYHQAIYKDFFCLPE